MANLRAFDKGKEELQDRLRKLHEEKHLIVNLLERLLSRMDEMVGHVAGISNINQFLCQFMNATSTMEQMFLKLFKIHVLLTEETYVDTEQRVNHMAITYAIHQNDCSSSSDLSVLPAKEVYHCLSLGPSIRSPGQLSPSAEAASPTVQPLNTGKTSSCSTPSNVPAAQTDRAHNSPTTVPSTPTQQVATISPPTAPSYASPNDANLSKIITKSSSASSLSATAPKDTTLHVPKGAAVSRSPGTTAPAALYQASSSSVAAPEKLNGAVPCSPFAAKKSALPNFECGDSSLDDCDSDAASVDVTVLKANVPPAIPSPPQSTLRFPQTTPKYVAARSSSADASIKLSQDGNAVSYVKATPEIVGGEKCLDIPPLSIKAMGVMQKVALSFYKSPSEFWLQLESSKDTLESLLEALHNHYSGQASVSGFEAKIGMYCVAFYAEDGHWYRARVLQVMSDHAKVIYIDFGNSDRVELQNLRPLDERFASLPAQAICCCIKGLHRLPDQSTRSMVAMRAFRDKISSCSKLQAIFYQRDEILDRYIVEVVTINNNQGMINLSQQFLSTCESEELRPGAPPQTALVNAKPAMADAVATLVPLPPPTPVCVPPPILPEEDTFNVMLSVVFNPSDFYGQLLTKSAAEHNATEELQVQLNRCGTQSMAPPEDWVTEGSYWICLYTGDKNWYRVRVVEVLHEQQSRRFKVFYVDYGNRGMAQCSELRPLPAELAKLPACAIRMALSFVGPKGPRWDAPAKQVFVSQAGFTQPLEAERKRQLQEGVETVLEVILWNKANPEVAINLNILLVEQGVAVFKNEESDL
uniref:Putative transcriptional coactivator n=1 Tax=Ixodes ricinus TaxID=34613 RepID=A0A131Y945_IXORI